MLNFIMDGLDLPLRFTMADYEIVSKAAYPMGVQEYNIGSLLIAGRFYRFMGYCQGFQKLILRVLIACTDNIITQP